MVLKSGERGIITPGLYNTNERAETDLYTAHEESNAET